MGLAKRIAWVIGGALAFLLFAALMHSEATPIHPDLKKMLAQPQEPAEYPLARAGWNGPETSPAPEVSPNPTLERLGPAASAREAHTSLKTAVIPDFRAVAGVLLCILMLRRIRSGPKTSRAKSDDATQRRSEEFSRAA
jgi:hypothetical protein